MNESTFLTPLQQHLAKVLWREDCVRRGRVLLASGRVSDFYFDGKAAMLKSNLAEPIATLLHSIMGNNLPDYVLGDGVGGALAVGLVVNYSGRHGPKGISGLVIEEGLLMGLHPTETLRGKQVAIVEDTVTTGGSVMRAKGFLDGTGAIVTNVYALMDREEGGAQTFADADLIFKSGLTKSQLLAAEPRR